MGFRVVTLCSGADPNKAGRVCDSGDRPYVRMTRAFTLIELLVVIAIIAVLIALSLPVTRLVREQGHETVCRSNLHQMTVMLKTYCSDHDGLFPNPAYIYHSRESFISHDAAAPSRSPYGAGHPWTCRWHDAGIGPSSTLLRDHRELQGSLIPYLGNPKVLLCKTGVRAYLERGCNNQDPNKPRRPQPSLGGAIGGGGGIPLRHEEPDPNEFLHIAPQYCYTMNGNLHRTFLTGTLAGAGGPVAARSVRITTIRRETQVTRSPAEVFAFGEENSWPINTESRWPAPYNLSGPWGGTQDGTMNGPGDPIDPDVPKFRVTGAITIGSLDIGPSYTTFDTSPQRPYASTMPQTDVGDAFATYHRPHGGDLNTGCSYVSMLDGHVRKVTLADQLRRSRRVAGLPESSLGPGGNLYLAWPLDVPPLGGWENQ
ncbi:MAG TPA: type II secretion system protein [Sedimentisphaerales bacterium]|nr:type II secretion system protein [Sedimentisphaerales bacterium]HRV49541.1 type II secretion system protein [Sedimentisphaerales bacterium]